MRFNAKRGPQREVGQPDGDLCGGRFDLKYAVGMLGDAAKDGEIDTDLEVTIKSDLVTAMSDDEHAERAGNNDDLNSGKRWLTKARAKKEAALRLLELALKQ